MSLTESAQVRPDKRFVDTLPELEASTGSNRVNHVFAQRWSL